MLKISVSENDHIQGDINAPVTLVEYGDYECPACGQAAPIIKLVQKHFGNKLRFVFRNFPLTEIHPFAEVAAETAEFSGEQQQYWEMHDLIYVNQEQLSIPMLFELAKSLNQSKTEIEAALQNGTYKEKIKNDLLGGVHSDVNSTPTFFINGRKHNGSFAFDELTEAIDQHLI